MSSQEKRNKKLLFIEIAGDLLTSLFKFIIGIVSHSSAVIAEGFHSLADTTNQIFLLIGIERSKKQPDKIHPFGYGKESFFWAFMSAIFILAVSATMAIWEGINQIRNPRIISDFRLGFLILGVSAIFQLITLSFSSEHFYRFFKNIKGKGNFFRRLKSVKEPTIINLWFGDIAAIAGNIIAGIALFLTMTTGNVIFDGLASILIGLILAGLAIFLIRDSQELLIGEAVSPAVYEEMVSLISEVEEVESIISLKTMHLSPTEVLVNADLEFKDGLTTQEIERIIDVIERKLKKKIPNLSQIYIEAETKY